MSDSIKSWLCGITLALPILVVILCIISRILEGGFKQMPDQEETHDGQEG